MYGMTGVSKSARDCKKEPVRACKKEFGRGTSAPGTQRDALCLAEENTGGWRESRKMKKNSVFSAITF